MPDLLTPPLRLGVSANALALVRVARFGAPPEVLAEQACDIDHAAAWQEALEAVLAPAAGQKLVIVFADDLLRTWQVAPPQGASRIGDLEAAAALRFQNLFGASPSDWKLAAAWRADRPFIATAAPRNIWNMLEACAARHQMTIVEAVPHFAAAWNRWRNARIEGAWFGVLHGGLLTLGMTDASGLMNLHTLAVPVGAGHDWLATQVSREALRQQTPAPERLQLTGQVPDSWCKPGDALTVSRLGEPTDDALKAGASAVRLATTGGQTGAIGLRALRLDFAAPTVPGMLHRTRPAAWALGLLGIALLAGAIAVAWHQQHQRERYDAELAAALQRAARPLPSAQPKAAPIAEVQAMATNAIILQLNLPWRDLHDAVAGATPGTIALVALEPDARRRSLKITAEARDADGMIAYVEELKKQEIFQSVVLARHEVSEADPNRPVRFQLDAQWAAR
jgi:hypothetical protein